MRLLRVLVLLMLLPGLLVPGGLGVRVCLCAEDAACCATTAACDDVAECCEVVVSCCRGSSSADTGLGPVAGAQPTCECIHVATPPAPPSTTPGAVGVDIALPPQVEAVPREWAVPAVASAIHASARPPPPRLASRHRPLLL